MKKLLLALALACAANAADDIDPVFAELSGTRTPGCVVGLMRDETLVFARGYGMANLEHHVAITPKSVFGIQSTSKQFVAMAVILLIQEGRLSFDDDVRKYIPELPDYGHTITIRHLLDHTSGLRDIGILTQDQGWHREEALSRAHIMRLITRQKALNHPPGAAPIYTNTGYFLLPIIVERITGERFAHFAKRRIFDPLGMSHTVYREDADAILADRVTAYRKDADGTWRIAGNSKNNVFTTVEDLARWSRNFAQPVVGGAEAIRWMTTWGRLNTGEPTEWGLGLSPLKYRGLEGIYFSGGGGDGTSVLARFPKENLALMILCNAGLPLNAEVFARKVLDVVLAKEIATAEAAPPTPPIPDPPAVPVSREDLRRHAGLYFTTHLGPWTRTFREENGKLRIVLSPERSVDLIPLGAGRFRAAGSTTEYAFTRDRVRRIAENEPAIEFTRVDETAPASLEEFTGTYWNDEVEAALTFTLRDGKLHHALPRQETPDPLQPMFRDAFSDGPLVFRFRRDPRGRITGVTKHWDRVWELEYVRR